MRSYIRHPSDIPINYELDGDPSTCGECLTNVSEGGLCFCTSRSIPRGAEISIHIPIVTPDFVAEGTVAWCKKLEDSYLIGVQFRHEAIEYSVRMVEQVCHIEHFRQEILQNEGRQLTGEEAAMEWITLNASEFPK